MPGASRSVSPPRSISEQIASELRDEILRGRFRSGERLPSERDLAERFRVHRGSVREAFVKLEQLGLAVIRPGGARVAPLEDASLDVVEHLLALEDPPDPEIVDQVLEAFGGLFALAGRLGVERAGEEARAAILAVLARLREPGLESGKQFEMLHDLGDQLIDASGNLVLKLVRRGVNTHFMERLPGHDRRRPPPEALRIALILELAAAVETCDGAAAAEVIHRLSAAMRSETVAALAAERSDRVAMGGGS